MSAVDDIMSGACRALSIWQPWAGLIAVGQKDVENRTWHGQYRGWLLIHASKRTEAIGRNAPEECRHLGAFLAVARVVDWTTWDGRRQAGKPISDWHEADYEGIYLEDVTPLVEPVPARGRQGLYMPTQEELIAVAAQLPVENTKYNRGQEETRP